MSGLILNPQLKMSETATHVFFLNGPFSQWYPATFRARPRKDGECLTFNCAEQYMMAAKAALFGDCAIFNMIMAADQHPRDWRVAPRLQKELGRKVHGRDGGPWDAEDVAFWAAHDRAIVFRGNWEKFSQNENLRAFLVATGTKVLVEGAHYDRIWGVGLAWDDPRIADPANWQGRNQLGEALMQVREALVDP